jgi:hypothetical protein
MKAAGKDMRKAALQVDKTVVEKAATRAAELDTM